MAEASMPIQGAYSFFITLFTQSSLTQADVFVYKFKIFVDSSDFVCGDC